MTNNKISQLIKAASITVDKNKAAILTGVGIASETGAIIHGMWVSPKIRDAVNIRKDELGVNKLSPQELFKVVWKPLLPTITLWGTGCYCLIKSNRISETNGAIAAAAASLAESTLNDIKREAKEEKKEKALNEVQDQAAVKSVQNLDVSKLNIYDTGNGTNIFYDPLCQDAIKSDMTFLQQRVLVLNQEYQKGKDEWVNYDDFRTCLGFPSNNFAQCLFFHFDDRGPIEISFAVAPVLGSQENMNVIRYNYWPVFGGRYTNELPRPEDLALSEVDNAIHRTRSI